MVEQRTARAYMTTLLQRIPHNVAVVTYEGVVQSMNVRIIMPGRKSRKPKAPSRKAPHGAGKAEVHPDRPIPAIVSQPKGTY